MLGRLALNGRDLSLATTKGTVLALLARRCNERVAVEELAAAVWPNGRPTTYRKAIQVAVFRLREMAGAGSAAAGGWLVSRPDAYELHCEPDAVDANRVERLVRTGLHDLAEGDPHAASRALRQALAEWAEPFGGDEHVELRPWVERLRQAHRAAVAGVLEADVRLGREDLAELERAVAAEPYDERRWAHLMVALFRRGRQADALAVFIRARELLVEELGIEPGPYLRRVEQEVLLQEGPLLAIAGRTGESPVGASMRKAWPLAPSPIGPVVLRDAELVSIEARLGNGRAVTIVGPPGVGKTALAATIANAWHATPHAWVALGDVPRSAGAVVDIATRLGVVSELVADTVTFTQATAALIGDRPLLLVLDNAEHLVDTVEPLITALLRSCPNLTVLATSRRPLGIAVEQVHALRPFETQPGDAAAGPGVSCAARYLLTRGQQGGTASGEPNPTEVVALNAIARRVGGLALGLEQAATQLRRLSAVELAGRLDLLDEADGSGGVGDAIEWSLALLSPAALEVLTALAHLESDWSLDRAEAIGGKLGLAAGRVAAAVGELAAQSLITIGGDGPPWRRIIEPIRDHVRRRNRSAAEVAPHATPSFALACARTIVDEVGVAARLLEGHDQALGVRALRDLMPEIRRATIWASSAGEAELVARLLAALRVWWWASGTYADGQTLHQIAEPALRAWRCVSDEEHRWWLRASAARVLVRPGFASPGAHVDELRQMLALATEVGTDGDVSWIAHLLAAGMSFTNDDLDAARAHARTALERARSAKDPWLAGWAHYATALACARDDPLEGLGQLEQATASFKQSGDLLCAARVTMFRAHGLRIFGITDSSDAALHEAGEWCAALEAAPVTQLDCELGVAQNAHADGRLSEAADLYRSLVPRLSSVGDLRCAAVAQRALGSILVEQGDLDGGNALVLHALEVLRDVGSEDTEIGSTCLVRAEIAVRRGHTEQAARLVGRARVLAAGSGIPMEQRELRHLEELAGTLRELLGSESFERQLLRGREDIHL